MPAHEARLVQQYEDRHHVYQSFGTGLVADLAQQLLPDGGRVLDIGCASGGLLELLRPRAGYAAGLELSPSAAEQARRHADEVVTAALDAEPAPTFGIDAFDLVVCADVLEHLVDPVAALRRVAGWCAPTGRILISVPNIGHFTARWRVATGRFGYDDEGGIFDAGHLHFFTPQLLDDLVHASGLDVESRHAVVPALRNAIPAVERLPARLRRRVERRWQAVGRRRPELLGYQSVCVARHPDEGA